MDKQTKPIKKVPVNVETNLSKILQAEKGVVPNYLRSSL